MAEMNEIFTRIQLKYDSYTAWTTNNPTLFAGEIAIAKLVSDVTISNNNEIYIVDYTNNQLLLLNNSTGLQSKYSFPKVEMVLQIFNTLIIAILYFTT